MPRSAVRETRRLDVILAGAFMNLSKILLTGCAAVLIGVSPPAFAQHHGGGGGHNGGGGGHSGGQGGQGGHSRGGSASREGGVSRGESRATSPRSAPSSQGGVSRGEAMGPRGYANVRGRVVPRYSIVAPVHFYRPYYTFQPRLSLGFGLWAGYPFAYSYAYYDPFYYPYGSPFYYPPYGYANPYGYPPYDGYYPPSGYPATSYPAYPPASGYPPRSNYPPSAYRSDRQEAPGSIDVQPGQVNTGGLSFEITPTTAQLFVDGTLVGAVGQFTPTTQPLGLPAGRHQIEVRAPGYRTMLFDVEIIAGQVIPYQGALER